MGEQRETRRQRLRRLAAERFENNTRVLREMRVVPRDVGRVINDIRGIGETGVVLSLVERLRNREETGNGNTGNTGS